MSPAEDQEIPAWSQEAYRCRDFTRAEIQPNFIDFRNWSKNRKRTRSITTGSTNDDVEISCHLPGRRLPPLICLLIVPAWVKHPFDEQKQRLLSPDVKISEVATQISQISWIFAIERRRKGRVGNSSNGVLWKRRGSRQIDVDVIRPAVGGTLDRLALKSLIFKIVISWVL